MLRPATDGDIDCLVRDMRPSDIEEVTWTGNRTKNPGDFADSLKEYRKNHGMDASWCSKGLIGCMGVAPVKTGSKEGIVWFLGTYLADEMPIAMTRDCAAWLGKNKKNWDWMGNIVPRNFAMRQNWLRVLGFDILDEDVLFSGHRFVPFEAHFPTRPERRGAAR